MRCPSCEPDYCACADFYGSRIDYWQRIKPMSIDWNDPRYASRYTTPVSGAPPIDWQARAEAAEAKVAEQEATIRTLRAARDAAEQRALAEGVALGIDAAEQAAEDATDTCCDDCCLDMSGDIQIAIRNLDPAAIIAAHTRAKAMGELIAGEADLI